MATTPDDIAALLGDLIRFGAVQSVTGARAVVKCGDILSPPLPWISLSGLFGLWVAPSEGQQVVLFCPEGDIEAGFILNGLVSDAFPPPDSGPLKLTLKCPDGTVLSYDAAAHALTLNLASGTISITAPDGVALIADMDQDGKLHVSGDVSFDGNLDVGGNLTVKGQSHLGDGADKPAKRIDDSPAATVTMK